MGGSPNQIVCPACGKIRMETPPGTTPLPTIGTAMKASGAAGRCGCGKQKQERRDAADPASEEA